MCLSTCHQCQYFSAPKHHGDIECSVNPSYWWVWYAGEYSAHDALRA